MRDVPDVSVSTIGLPKSRSEGPDTVRYAYAAGIVDGEGSLSVRTNSQGCWEAHVCVANTDQKLMDVLQSTFGGLVRCVNEWKDQPKWKILYRWHLNGQSALPFIEKILPHLVIKKEQAQLMIEFLTELSPGKGGKLTSTQKVRRDEIGERFKVINRRGRVKLSDLVDLSEVSVI